MSRSKRRVLSWKKRLVDRLDNEVKGDCAYQVVWLVRHLEQYLERWLGFAQMENMSVAGTLRNDLFCVALAAAEIIDDKITCLNAASPFPVGEWKHFRNTLEWIQKTPDRSELGLITDTFESFRKKLPNGAIKISLNGQT